MKSAGLLLRCKQALQALKDQLEPALRERQGLNLQQPCQSGTAMMATPGISGSR